MSSKKKQGVKRLAPSGAVESAKRIEQLIRTHNMLYGEADASRLVCFTAADLMIRDSKLINYMQQYDLDIHMVALHEEFGFFSGRQKRFCDKTVEVDRRFDAMKREDLKDDPNAEYSIMKLEQALQAACGDDYVPREERYHAKFYYNGVLWDETNVAEADARMLRSKGEGYRDGERT